MDPYYRCRFLAVSFAASLVISMPGVIRAESDQATSTKLPLHLFQDAEATGITEILQARWMGSSDSALCDLEWGETPRHGSTCVRIEQKDAGRWGSLIWQKSGTAEAFDLTGVSRITFWARGEKGGEKVDFKFSVFPESRLVRMTGPMALRSVQLTNEWTSYSINLENRNLGAVKLGMALSVLSPDDGTTIFLDSISLE